MKNISDPRSSRGSALAVSLLFTVVCGILAFSILRWSVTERRLNARAAGWLAARNAAEGLAEYAFSQVRNDFETKAIPGIFKPGTANALNIPPASVFAGSTVVTGALSSSNPNGLEVIGGPVVPIPNNAGTFTGLFYVDPANLNNQFDPLKGKWIFRQDIVILARATVVTSVGRPITHYVTETVSVRGAPLFAHAIFYGGDLELTPGPQMDVSGPVHANGNVFIANGNSGGLNFSGPVTTAGNIFHAWSSNLTAAQGNGGETLGQEKVTFLNISGNQTSMKATSNASSWKDSTMGASNGVSGTAALNALINPTRTLAFRQYAASTWGGNLLTGASGIQVYNPIALNQAIDAAGTIPNPSVLIDAPTPPATTDAYYTAKTEVENQKKSMQAGLYIKVVTTAAGAATVSLYGPAGSAPAGTPAAQVGPNGGLLLNPPANVLNAPSAATPPLVAYLPFRRLKKVVSKAGSVYTSTYTVLKPDGSTDATKVVAPTTASSGTTGTSYSVYADSNTGSFGYGMYDQRRGLSSASTTTTTPNADGQIDLVQIDMRAVTALVNAMKTSTTDANAITYTDPTDHTVKLWNNANAVASGLVSATQPLDAEKLPWNGAVYIDVQAPNSGTSSQTTSVRLVNGTVASGSSLIPDYGPHGIGLSVATNAPLYVLGHLNADGNITSSSTSTMPDDGKDGTSGNISKETPLSLAADSITILSPGWADTGSLTLKPNAPNDVEIAAALMVGTTATATAYSGGAHNLPRFLEDWSGNTVAIRGSLVAMFNSRISSQPWDLSYYGAPNRKWGFDSIYKNGTYPPFSPKVVSYRRVDFSDLSAAQYAAQKAALWP